MNPNGRPPTATRPVVFAIKLSLRVGRDDDVIAYLQSAPPRLRAQYVLQALRTGQLPSAATDTPASDETLDFSQLLQ